MYLLTDPWYRLLSTWLYFRMSRQPPTHEYAISQQHTSPSSDTYSYNSRPSRSVVDRLSSGQQQGYGAPLPVTADDWERANELQHPAYRQPRPSVYSLYPGGYAAQQHSQSQPEAMHPRLRQDVVDPAAQAAWRRHRQQQQQWQHGCAREGITAQHSIQLTI